MESEVAVEVGVEVDVAVGVGVAFGVAVGVGLEATTVKVTVIVGATLVPVPPVPLHGVAAKVWFPSAVGVHVRSNGAAESVFRTTPSRLNTTLCVLAFTCAVTV